MSLWNVKGGNISYGQQLYVAFSRARAMAAVKVKVL